MDAMHNWLELDEEWNKNCLKEQIFLRLRRNTDTPEAEGVHRPYSEIYARGAALMGKDPEDTWIENPNIWVGCGRLWITP
jgi:hypothetical protein